MKTINIRYSPRGAISGIDVPEDIELGDITEIQCKKGLFMMRIVRWDPVENNCTSCVLYNDRCITGTRGICNRIISRKRVCFQDLHKMLEDL